MNSCLGSHHVWHDTGVSLDCYEILNQIIFGNVTFCKIFSCCPIGADDIQEGDNFDGKSSSLKSTWLQHDQALLLPWFSQWNPVVIKNSKYHVITMSIEVLMEMTNKKNKNWNQNRKKLVPVIFYYLIMNTKGGIARIFGRWAGLITNFTKEPSWNNKYLFKRITIRDYIAWWAYQHEWEYHTWRILINYACKLVSHCVECLHNCVLSTKLGRSVEWQILSYEQAKKCKTCKIFN